jgi:3',5'-cyclic AMP phosphodiesterase CpdA
VRVRGPIALIGLDSAVSTAPHLATGRLGAGQLAPLADLLADLGARKLCRVVLVHHPPTRTGVSWRRRLEDGPELCAILARAGAELVLHGHSHRAARDTIASKHGLIPVCGVPATSSAVRSRPGAYQVFAIEQRAGRFAIQCEVREIEPRSRAMKAGRNEALS